MSGVVAQAVKKLASKAMERTDLMDVPIFAARIGAPMMHSQARFVTTEAEWVESEA